MIKKPELQTLKYYDYFELADWLVATNVWTADESEEFWDYFCDGGISRGSLRTIYDDEQFTEEELIVTETDNKYDRHAKSAFKLIEAVREDGEERCDVEVYANW